jgi:RNA polymerase sigma factor (sigma-70 family)
MTEIRLKWRATSATGKARCMPSPPRGGVDLRHSLLKRCLRWVNGNRAEAEDLLGDAWLRLLESSSRGDARPCNQSAFLLTVIDNLGRDRLRRARRWRHGGPNEYESLEATTTTAEQLVLMRERLVRTAQQLDTMRCRERAALLLRSSGVEYGAIAAVLATSETNARKLVETARKQVVLGTAAASRG